MSVDPSVKEKAAVLDDFAMTYEVSVRALDAERYLEEFYDWYEIKSREHKLIPSGSSFHETLDELFGDVWQPIAEKTEGLFGEPKRIMIFEDSTELIGELEGPDGLAVFYIVFDLMFCEYDRFTLCFLSGTNN